MADFINQETFLESIKKGSQAPVKDQVSVVQSGETDAADPSATGGLIALGATVLGAATLGRRIPGLRNYFKIPQAPKQITFDVPKPTTTGNLPTATGQASDLVTKEPSKALVRMKSRFGEVQDIPFSYGAGYKGTNPLMGSAVFDRVMEAPFDKAPAAQWAKFLSEAGRGDLRVSTGPLTGVSRQVQAEELADLNLLARDRDGKMSGFLKYAQDNNIEIDRDTLLGIVRNHPINNIKKVVFDVEGEPLSDLKTIQSDLYKISDKISDESKRAAAKTAFFDDVSQVLDGSTTANVMNANREIPQDAIGAVQKKIIKAAQDIPEVRSDLQNWLVNFNRFTGKYNARGARLDESQIFKSGNIKFQPKSGESTPNYFPRYKNYGGGEYNLLAGENFTENVYVLDARIPNTRQDAFRYIEGDPHYFTNKELVFARLDDLPNPKLGNVRHMRVSEVQSDLHSTAKSSNKTSRENFFKERVNTFNSDALVNDLKRKRTEILDQLTPFTEIGRGALTQAQEQTKKRLMYKLQQIDRDAVSKIANAQGLDKTTYGPMGSNINDYVVKDLLRTMAERNVNAISIVPAPMNQNAKNLFDASKIGNELNYGLMDGKKLVKNAQGKLVKSSGYSDLNESLRRIARQYGADFKMLPMPKSNPNKRFKVIEKLKTGEDYGRAAETTDPLQRRHFNKVERNSRIYENHIGAADSEEAARRIAASFERRGSPKGEIVIEELSPESPRNYENVMTLVAPNDVLKKFLLPFKAYMNEGGLVDKTNIFKPII